jgi:hypothetical protein
MKIPKIQWKFDAYNAFQTNTERDMEEKKHTQE